MPRLEGLREEFRVLRQLARGMPQHGSQEQKLAAFYGDQASAYDRFRERLLAGRQELIADLPLSPGDTVVELGAGTGRNLDFFPEARQRDCRFELVDLCAPLLQQARRRVQDRHNVRVVEADAGAYQPDAAVQVVVLSYALTMMPDWLGVIGNARRMLAAGGCIAVVDFHVSPALGAPGREQHGWLTRKFWPRWFAHDGVQVDAARLQALSEAFPRHRLVEGRHRLPYMPGIRVPYYRFVGVR